MIRNRIKGADKGGPTTSEFRELKEKLERIEGQVNTHDKTLDNHQETIDATKNNIQNIQTNIKSIEDNLASMKDRLDECNPLLNFSKQT